jgi:hypothetical protein
MKKTLEEILNAKRARCLGTEVTIVRWDTEQGKEVIDGKGTIIDVTRIEMPHDWPTSWTSDGKIYGYIVEREDGTRHTYRRSELLWPGREKDAWIQWHVTFSPSPQHESAFSMKADWELRRYIRNRNIPPNPPYPPEQMYPYPKKEGEES